MAQFQHSRPKPRKHLCPSGFQRQGKSCEVARQIRTDDRLLVAQRAGGILPSGGIALFIGGEPALFCCISLGLGLLDRLVYLKYGLAIILGFIGVKLVMEALHDNSLPFVADGHPLEQVPLVPTWLSLVAIVGCLGVAAGASAAHTLVDSRRQR